MATINMSLHRYSFELWISTICVPQKIDGFSQLQNRDNRVSVGEYYEDVVGDCKLQTLLSVSTYKGGIVIYTKKFCEDRAFQTLRYQQKIKETYYAQEDRAVDPAQ